MYNIQNLRWLMKKFYIGVLFVILLFAIFGCTEATFTTGQTTNITTSASSTSSQLLSTTDNINYYNDELDNPLAGTDVGGVDILNFSETESKFTLENENIRIVFNSDNGSINEICNKMSKIYFTRNNQTSFGIKIQKRNTELLFSTFSYSVIEDIAEVKSIRLIWVFAHTLTAIIDVHLHVEDSEVVFNLQILNNDPNDPVVSVKYPNIENFGSLYLPERDYFASPIASGYLFNNPTFNFNSEVFRGITKEEGIYPSGWNNPMQFMAYYSEGIGGFVLWTRDSGSTIKSYEFIGKGTDKLTTGIYHYLDDSAITDVNFNYDIAISCLSQGYWEEAADMYRDWAINQPWGDKGKLSARTDIDSSLFEETGLVNFGIRGDGSTYWLDLSSIYDLYHEKINAKITNIFLNSWQRIHLSNEFNSDWDSYFPANLNNVFINQINSYDDQFILFEFNTLYNKNYFKTVVDGWADRAVRNFNGTKSIFSWRSGSDFREWYFICPSTEEWVDFSFSKDQEMLEYGANGLYHDVGVAAVAPRMCFDSSHPHGTRINIIEDYIEIERQSKQLAIDNGSNSVGQELIFEQLLPYVDFYQARANAGLLSWMESDRFRGLLENGSANKIPLFDYVYHEYGGLRVDGFMMPLSEIGGGYYYTLAKTVLEGGLPEFNYEFMPTTLQYDEIDMDMLAFVGELAKARTDYGKNYLVYGKMVKAPNTGLGKITFSFRNSNIVLGNEILQGSIIVDKVVTSAFQSNGKTAIFLCNITPEDLECNFILQAERDYGIEFGSVYINGVKLGDIVDGKANISLSLNSREVMMIEIY